MSGVNRRRHVLTTLGLALVLLFGGVQSAFAWVEYVIRTRPSTYHYGNSGYIDVFSGSPAFQDQKVTAIETSKTNKTGWCEAGITYEHYSSSDPTVTKRAFIAWGTDGAYSDQILGYVSSGSTHRFHVGYSATSGAGYEAERHYFWYDNDIVKSIPKGWVGQMTSCWPWTLNELNNTSTSAGYDNGGHFTGLRWKSNVWGQWYSWGTVYDYENYRMVNGIVSGPDPYYAAYAGGPNEVIVKRR